VKRPWPTWRWWTKHLAKRFLFLLKFEPQSRYLVYSSWHSIGYNTVTNTTLPTGSRKGQRPSISHSTYIHGLLKLEDGTLVLSRRVIACRVNF
jgi:hypothetical protein